MSYKIYNGQEYDWSDKRIVCMADADGASVFPVEGPAGKKRMLSWSEDEAEDAYFNVLMEDYGWCPDCWRLNCICSCDLDDPTEEECSLTGPEESGAQAGPQLPVESGSTVPE